MPRTLFFDPKILDHQLDLVHHPRPNKLLVASYSRPTIAGDLALDIQL